MILHRLFPILLVLGSGLVPPALAQPQVQGDFYSGARRQQGAAIRFCLWPTSPLYAFDKAIGEELAAVQLLEAEFYDAPQGPAGTQELFEQQLFIHLMDNCDAAMGSSLDWQPLPEWLTITRPYISIPQHLVTLSADVSTLDGLPAGAKVGSVVFSVADMVLALYLEQLPEHDRPVRVPFGSGEDVLAAVLDKNLDAGIVSAQSFGAFRQQHTDADSMRALPPAPLTIPPATYGMTLLVRDRYLAQALDQAIVELERDGTLDRVAQSFGYVP